MKKIIFTLFFTLAMVTNTVYSQEVYLLNEECFANIISFEKWETNDYSGKYEYGWPATPNPDGTEADGFGYELIIEHYPSIVYAYFEGFVEAESEHQLLDEASITDNKFYCSGIDNFTYNTELTGEFIEAKCKTENGKTIYIKGLLVKVGSDINFFELMNE